MLDRAVTWVADTMAIIGGCVLVLVIAVICASIAGRELSDLAHSGALGPVGEIILGFGVGPILGDFELVEAGVAFAIFAFLPVTQRRFAHAKVDVFAKALGPRVDQALATVWLVVFALILALITWRLFAGMQDKIRYGETTFLIQFPVWWGFAAGLVAAGIATLVAIYCAALAMLGRMQDE